MNGHLRTGLVVSSLLASFTATAGIPGKYSYVSASVTPVWLYGNTSTWGNDINNAGQIVGAFQVANAERHAFMYKASSSEVQETKLRLVPNTSLR